MLIYYNMGDWATILQLQFRKKLHFNPYIIKYVLDRTSNKKIWIVLSSAGTPASCFSRWLFSSRPVVLSGSPQPTNVVLMLDQRCRRWANIKTTLGLTFRVCWHISLFLQEWQPSSNYAVCKMHLMNVQGKHILQVLPSRLASCGCLRRTFVWP